MNGEKMAIIAVDPVNSFFKNGTLPVPEAEEIIAPINNLGRIGLTTYVVREGHPKSSKHFEKWPEHGVRNTWGAEVHKDLALSEAKYFVKGTSHKDDGYSGFEGVSEVDGKTTLLEDLRISGITVLAIVGLATDYCVMATALDGRKNGFRTLLVTDAVRAVNIKPDDGERAILDMVNAGVELIDSKRLMSHWRN